MQVKINCVVMEGKNTQDILSLCELTRRLPLSVRFIEEMPFNGSSHDYAGLSWDHKKIFDTICLKYPELYKMKDPAYSTSLNYQVKGYEGTIGIIPAYSRTFCGTCNRLRITPKGMLQTCLYGTGDLNIKNMIRSGMDNTNIENHLRKAIASRHRDGWEAQQDVAKTSLSRSMAAIGG
jgi:cyclic pyranopterin phosphate synthase